MGRRKREREKIEERGGADDGEGKGGIMMNG